MSFSPRAEQTAIVRFALPFLGRMVPRRVARGGFMLIYKDKLGREQRDQHRTIPELVAARDALPKRNRLGDGRWNTKFAVIVADDLFLDAQDMLCAWAPESIEKLKRAEGERRQSERSDLARHGSVRKMHKAGPPVAAADPVVRPAAGQSVRAIRRERRAERDAARDATWRARAQHAEKAAGRVNGVGFKVCLVFGPLWLVLMFVGVLVADWPAVLGATIVSGLGLVPRFVKPGGER